MPKRTKRKPAGSIKGTKRACSSASSSTSTSGSSLVATVPGDVMCLIMVASSSDITELFMVWSFVCKATRVLLSKCCAPYEITIKRPLSVRALHCVSATARAAAISTSICRPLALIIAAPAEHEIIPQQRATWPALTSLDLSGNAHVKASVLFALSRDSVLPRLQMLSLSGCVAFEADALRFVASMPRIHTLDLGACYQMTDLGLGYIAKMQGLRTLNLRHCNGISYMGLHHLAEAKLPLVSLDLSNCRNITEGLMHLAPTLPNLRTLKLRNCFRQESHPRAGEVAATKMRIGNCLAGLKQLTSLDVSDCDDMVDDATLACLSASEHLTELDISTNRGVSAKGLRHLANLPLKTLSLAYNIMRIGDDALAQLSGLPLTSLDLTFCDAVTSAGLAHLAQLPLEKLDLFCCIQVGDAGLAHLSALRLSELNLGGCCKVTQAGLMHLAATLTHLGVSTRMTNGAIAHARRLSKRVTGHDTSHFRFVTVQYK